MLLGALYPSFSPSRRVGQSIRGFKKGLNEDGDDDELEAGDPVQRIEAKKDDKAS